MKLSITRESLLNNLRHMSAVVEKRTSIAILSNVKLKAGENQLELTATDNDIAIHGTTEAHVETPGTTTVSAHKLFEIISKIPEGVMVNMELTDNNNRLSITAGKAKFSLACLAADAFPDMTAVENGTTFTMKAEDLIKGLGKTQFAASGDDTRAYLTGVYLHIPEKQSDILRFVATDGHRLAKVDLPKPEKLKDLSGIILPRKCVAELRKLAEETKGLELTVSDTKIQATVTNPTGQMQLTSKVIDGTFPDYNRVIPQDNKETMAVARKTLLQAVDRVAILSHEKSRSIRFELGKNQLTISANNPDQENAAEEVKVDYGAQDMAIGFNAKYVADIGGQAEGDDLTFHFKDAQSPVLVTDTKDTSTLFVVMPMRV